MSLDWWRERERERSASGGGGGGEAIRKRHDRPSVERSPDETAAQLSSAQLSLTLFFFFFFFFFLGVVVGGERESECSCLFFSLYTNNGGGCLPACLPAWRMRLPPPLPPPPLLVQVSRRWRKTRGLWCCHNHGTPPSAAAAGRVLSWSQTRRERVSFAFSFCLAMTDDFIDSIPPSLSLLPFLLLLLLPAAAVWINVFFFPSSLFSQV